MNEHDPRCTGEFNEQEILDEVSEGGWYVIKVLDQTETPGWAYSIGLHRNFAHPEILVFGLNVDLMHSMINSIGEDVRSGKSFEIDQKYPDLIEAYACTFKPVAPIWYDSFVGFASWFYDGNDYPVLQCFWPDFESNFPWEPGFNQNLSWAQPLLFHADPNQAQAIDLLRLLDFEVPT